MALRLADIKRILESMGYTVEPGAKHWKVASPDGLCYPVPAHNGLRSELDKVYLRGLIRTFKLPKNVFD